MQPWWAEETSSVEFILRIEDAHKTTVEENEWFNRCPFVPFLAGVEDNGFTGGEETYVLMSNKITSGAGVFMK